MPFYQATISRVRAALTNTFSSIYPWFDQPEEVRAYKPANGGWSINEILEHITLTTHFLMIIVHKGYLKALKRAQSQKIEDAESDLDLLTPIGQRGTFPWTRPEHMVPVGKPVAEVLTLMHDQEHECLDILARMPHGEGSLYKVRMSVNNTGHIDLYQWFFFVAQHARRHIGQMEENLAEWQTKRVREDHPI
jgi:DinB superfamily